MPLVEQLLTISDEPGIVAARRIARQATAELGFSAMDQSRVTTAVSELARNVLRYAGSGTMEVRELHSEGGRKGIEIVMNDEGPGIENIDQAMQPGFTTGQGLGLGLSGTRRLMDEMEVTSGKGNGTRVVVRKWLR